MNKKTYSLLFSDGTTSNKPEANKTPIAFSFCTLSGNKIWIKLPIQSQKTTLKKAIIGIKHTKYVFRLINVSELYSLLGEIDEVNVFLSTLGMPTLTKERYWSTAVNTFLIIKIENDRRKVSCFLPTDEAIPVYVLDREAKENFCYKNKLTTENSIAPKPANKKLKETTLQSPDKKEEKTPPRRNYPRC